MDIIVGAGQMVQQVGALAALPEEPGLIPSAHMAAYNHMLT